MPVSHKYKVIFIHIPKCAGTSIEQLLDISTIDDFYCEHITSEVLAKVPSDKFTGKEYRVCTSKNLQHYTYRELVKCLPLDIVKNYKKISIVRHPFDRLISEFHFSENSVKTHKVFEEFIKKNLSLDSVTRNWLYDGHLETQTSYLINEQNDFSSIDRVYCFENLNECVKDIQLLTGKSDVPHLRKSDNRKDIESYFTSELKEIAYNFYKEDFINFNYKV